MAAPFAGMEAMGYPGPTGAKGTLVNVDGANNSFGPWTEIETSTSRLYKALGLSMGLGVNFSAGIQHIVAQLGIGSSGSEVACCSPFL